MAEGTRASAATKKEAIHDEDEPLEHERMSVGEVITYYTTLFVAGDPRGKRESKVIRIRSDIKHDYPIHLESQDSISRHDMVKRVKDTDGNTIEGGMWRKVYTYELIPGKIRGELASAVLKAAMKNIVRDSFAKIYGNGHSASKKRRREEPVDEVARPYKPKKPAAPAKSSKSTAKPISISKFFPPKANPAAPPAKVEKTKGSDSSPSRKRPSAASTDDDPLCFVRGSPVRLNKSATSHATKSSPHSLKPRATSNEVAPPATTPPRPMRPTSSSAKTKPATSPLKQALPSRRDTSPKTTGAGTSSPLGLMSKETASSAAVTAAASRNHDKSGCRRSIELSSQPLLSSPTPPRSTSSSNGRPREAKIDEDTFMSPASSARSASSTSHKSALGHRPRPFVPPYSASSSNASQQSSGSSTAQHTRRSLGSNSLRRRHPTPQLSAHGMPSIPSPTPSSTTDVALKALAVSAASSIKLKRLDDDDACDAKQKTSYSSPAKTNESPPQTKRRSTPPSDSKKSHRLAAYVNQKEREEEDDVTPRKKQWRHHVSTFQRRDKVDPARRLKTSTTSAPALHQTPMDAWVIPKKRATTP